MRKSNTNSNDSESDEVYDEEEDIQSNQSKMERSFMEQCQIQKKQQLAVNTLKVLEIPGTIQLMFMLFSFYQNDLSNIGISCSCKVKVSLNKIKIMSDNLNRNVQSCFEKIKAYLSKIVYTQLNHESKFKIFYSPYFIDKCQQIGFKLCKFNNIIYCHSNKLTENNLISTMRQLFLGQKIFTVGIKSRKSKQKQIYNYLREFIKKMKDHYDSQSQERKVVVELDTFELNINCIGVNQRDLVAIKNKFKNLLQSTVLMIFKFDNQQELQKKVQKLKKCANVMSTFPIIIAKIQQRALTIISKQNIIRKLLEKPKIIQILQLDEKTEIGMFIPRRYNFTQRKLMIQSICAKKGYDFTTMGGINHYFKKMFINQDQQINPKQVLDIIKEILNAIKQNKQKFDIPQQIKNIKKIRKQVQVTDGQFYSTGDISQDSQLSKVLKRTVLRQKLKLSKPFLIKYNICQAEQSKTIYWYVGSNNQKIHCQVADMKPDKEYFCGMYKQLGQQRNYFITSRLIID